MEYLQVKYYFLFSLCVRIYQIFWYLNPANTLYRIVDTLGEYQFVGYDEKLEDYLDSLGLPGKEYGAIVRAAEVRVVIREPPTLASGKKRRESLSGSDKKWSVIHYDKGKLYRLY